MNAKIIFISLIAVLLAAFVYVLTRHAIPSVLVCTSKVNIALHTQKEGVNIEGEIMQVLRISSGKGGVYSQVGTLDVNGKLYAINRATTLTFLGQESDGYWRTRRSAVIKNVNDDLPDKITDLLMTRQPLFYYKIMHIASNVYGLRDLRRTIMVCRAK